MWGWMEQDKLAIRSGGPNGLEESMVPKFQQRVFGAVKATGVRIFFHFQGVTDQGLFITERGDQEATGRY